MSLPINVKVHGTIFMKTLEAELRDKITFLSQFSEN